MKVYAGRPQTYNLKEVPCRRYRRSNRVDLLGGDIAMRLLFPLVILAGCAVSLQDIPALQ